MSVITGRRVIREDPRSPEKTPLSQRPYWTGTARQDAVPGRDYRWPTAGPAGPRAMRAGVPRNYPRDYEDQHGQSEENKKRPRQPSEQEPINASRHAPVTIRGTGGRRGPRRGSALPVRVIADYFPSKAARFSGKPYIMGSRGTAHDSGSSVLLLGGIRLGPGNVRTPDTPAAPEAPAPRWSGTYPPAPSEARNTAEPILPVQRESDFSMAASSFLSKSHSNCTNVPAVLE
jgi:hypothetical protein